VGTPGFCTPFAELLGFVVRDRELAFVSSLDFEKARSIFMDYEGMQLGELTDAHADIVVLLGGLSMSKIGISPENAKEVAAEILEGSEKGRIIGVCFQSAVHAARNGMKSLTLIISSIPTWLLRCLKSEFFETNFQEFSWVFRNFPCFTDDKTESPLGL